MNRLRRETVKIWILATFAFLVASQAPPCGDFNLFVGEKPLNRKDFTVFRGVLDNSSNGASMTIAAWMRLDPDTAGPKQLLRLVLDPERIPNSENPNFTQFFSLVYDDSNASTPLLNISVSFNATFTKEESYKINIPANTWVYLVATFDYSRKMTKVQVSGRGVGGRISFLAMMPVNYPNFTIPSKFDVQVGCFQKDGNGKELEACTLGTVRDVTASLTFVSEPKFNYLINTPPNPQFLKFVFSPPERLESPIKDANGFNSEIILASLKLQSDGDSLPFYRLPGLTPLTKDFMSAYTVSWVLRPQNSLPDNFLLMVQKESPSAEVNLIEVWMRKSPGSPGWTVELLLPGIPEVRMPSTAIILPNKETSVSLGLSTVANNSTAVIIQVDSTSRAFEGGSNRVVKNGEFFLAAPVKDQLLVRSFSYVPNVAGLAWRTIIDPAKWQQSQCFDRCYLPVNRKGSNQLCFLCEEKSVEHGGLCLEYCPAGTFNRLGFGCVACASPRCEELSLSKFFSVSRLSPTSFEVSAASSLENFKGEFGQLFKLRIPEAEEGSEYNVTITPSSKASAICQLSLNKEKDWSSATVEIGPMRAPVIFDSDRTLVQGKPQTFKLGLNRAEDKKDLQTPAQANNSEPSQQQDFYGSPASEEHMERLGVATFAIFVIGMAVGVTGSLLRCKIIPPSSFLFQKTIQSFLMFHYLSFWVLYNCQLPNSFLAFFRRIFSLSTLTYQIFNSAALSNHNGSPGFAENWKSGYTRFEQEDVLNSFVLNFGLILLIQLIFIFLWVISKLVLRRANSLEYSEVDGREGVHLRPCIEGFPAPVWLHVIKIFQWKGLVSVFALFVIQTAVFSLYNLIQSSFRHPLWQFSFAMAIIYLVLIVALLTILVTKASQNSKKHGDALYEPNWGFLRWGLSQTPFKRSFQAVQYWLYFLSGIVLAAAYNSPITQIVLNLVLFTGFLILVAFLRPANDRADKVEQIISHILFWTAKILLLVIVIGDRTGSLSSFQSWQVGTGCIVLAFLLVLLNTSVIVYKFVAYWIDCATGHKNFLAMVAIPSDYIKPAEKPPVTSMFYDPSAPSSVFNGNSSAQFPDYQESKLHDDHSYRGFENASELMPSKTYGLVSQVPEPVSEMTPDVYFSIDPFYQSKMPENPAGAFSSKRDLTMRSVRDTFAPGGIGSFRANPGSNN